MIPLLKVRLPHEAHEALAPVLASGFVADGEQVRLFEERYAAFVGNPNFTALSDISGAITLALYMAGVRPGDEVIVSPLNCVATTMPILNLFARPVWCDVDADNGMPTAEHIKPCISERTKAILVYHWGGDVADLAPLVELARNRGIPIIDDAADGFGAEYRGRRLGNNGTDFTAISFQAVKHMTTGEGGGLFFRDPTHVEKARMLKRYGIHRPSFKQPNGDLNPASDIPEWGYNFYMNNIAATIGLTQLTHAAAMIQTYRQNAAFLRDAIRDMDGLREVKRVPGTDPSYWTFNLLVERRADFISALKAEGIASQRLHVRNDLYTCYGTGRQDLSGVNAFDERNVSIPCGWWLTQDDLAHIARVLRKGW